MNRISQRSTFIIHRSSLIVLLLSSVFCLLTPLSAATHVTATYDIGLNPRVMATVNGQPQYGLVFAQRNKPVNYNSVEYGSGVIYGYLDVNGALNDGAGNLYLDLIPNLGATPADGYYVVTFNIQGQVHAEIWVVPDLATVTAEVCRQAQPPSSTAPALFYQFLQEDGNGLPQRQKLNLTGAGVSCVDNAGQLRTDCTLSGGGFVPIASATTSGTVKTDQTVADPVVYLTSSTDSLLAAKVPTSRSVNTSAPLTGGGALSSDLTLSCPTCEVTGNRNAANGYAGLTASTKLNAAQGQEVWGSADLTDFADKSGTGTTILGGTITAPASNHVLTWNGSNWVNQAQLVTSVFSRTGTVTAQNGDYSASQVTNTLDATVANTLTNVTAPATPATGKTALWTDSTDRNLKAKDDAGAVSVTVKPQTCTGTDKVSAISTAGAVTCSTDQTGGAGGGYDALKGDTGTASKTGTEAIKVAGTANEITTSAADGTDDTVTASLASQLNLSGKEMLGGATPLKFEGATDNNIYLQFSITDPTVGTKTVTFPNADTVVPQSYTCTDQFATALSGSTGATTCSTATLASAQFANQGSTTTVLHGNAAGNPSWGSVSLTADVSGTLPAGNGGTGNAFFAVSGPATSVKTYTFPNASTTVLTTNAAVTTAQGGTGANNTATNGRTLRGNGTNFVTSAGAAAGAGSCTNQVVTAANDDAAPTCANVSSAMISDGVVASGDLATANKQEIKSIDIFDPTTADTNKVQLKFANAVTIQRVSCSTNVGTADIQLDERAEATPNTAGTNVMTATLQCTTTTGSTTSFTNATIAADAPLNLQITATASTPGVVRIHVDYQID